MAYTCIPVQHSDKHELTSQIVTEIASWSGILVSFTMLDGTDTLAQVIELMATVVHRLLLSTLFELSRY